MYTRTLTSALTALALTAGVVTPAVADDNPAQPTTVTTTTENKTESDTEKKDSKDTTGSADMDGTAIGVLAFLGMVGVTGIIGVVIGSVLKELGVKPLF